jgi:hypothetical protein
MTQAEDTRRIEEAPYYLMRREPEASVAELSGLLRHE